MFCFSLHPRGRPPASTSGHPSLSTSQSPAPGSPTQVGLSAKAVRKERYADMQAVALEMVQTISTVVSNIADTFPIPGLKIGLLALAEVIKKIQIMQTNVEGVEALKKRLDSLVARIYKLLNDWHGWNFPQSMLTRVAGLMNTWEAIAKRATQIRARSGLMRFIMSNRDAVKLAGLIGEINDSIQEIVTEGVLNIEAYVQEIHVEIKAIRAALQGTFMPTYAKMAPYDANDTRKSCLDGTRVDFLQRIYTCIAVACAQGVAIPKGGIVLWINGLGGTGKTTVARTVAEWCDKKEILGGSFFCSRSDADCSDPSLVFPTLCRHLCAHHGPFKDQIEEVLQRIPDITSFGLYRQFEELIVRPLEALDSPFPRSVFVIDALDELKDKGAKSTILLVIAKFVSRIAKFLLLVITSRPEERITALFEAARKDSLSASTTTLLMHDIPLEVALKDVRRYLDYGFADDIGVSAIQAGWPSDEEKDALANQSQGLFIYVVTAIKFIEDKAHGDPKGRLNLLRNPRPDSTEPQEFLSTLYSAIMVASCGNAAPALMGRIRKVLGAVVLAQEPLSPSALSLLLGFDEESVRNALTRLHSVLYVPAESHKPVRIIHPTFPEFLLRSHNAVVFEPAEPTSEATALYIQPAEQHWYLFSRCLEVMSGALHRDMIGIRYPAMFQSEVDNRQERVTEAVKPHVSYSSRFWGHHLRDGIKSAATLDVSKSFRSIVHEQLLYWIETCSLLDAMDKVIFALDAAREVCQMPAGPFTDLESLLADCRRFVVTYSPCIHAAPLQLYHSALGISPTASRVRTQYAHERKHALVVEHGASADWAPCLDTITGRACAVAFSPDRSCFVTGGWDNKATIRKTATRTPVLSFDGHTEYWVLCVAFSPDGLHVASGGKDEKVCVWQVSSGEAVHTLEGHTGEVCSVAYSGDGRRIVSATERGEVKLWDTTDGRCLLTLDRTGKWTDQVGISSDGGIIVRGDGASVSLYDVSSATSEALEFPDTVGACTFSPDSRYVAARSRRVIRVWAWPEKAVVRSIDVPDDLYGRLAFSHDSTLIGCGSRNGCVRLWPVASEDTPFIFQGHTGNVDDLACSPDGLQVISVASDGMIRVWDRTLPTFATAEHATVDSPPPPAPGPPRFALVLSGDKPIALLHLPTLGVGFEHLALGAQSADGAPTAMLFSDAVSAYAAVLQTVNDWYGNASARAWASLTGQQHTRLSRRPFAVSLDGSLMAYQSPADDKVVDVCNLSTGTVVATLTGHTRYVCSIAFSPDNARIATGSWDKSVKVWDTLTGALLCGHTEHTSWTGAVAFSPDGRLVASGSDDGTVRVFGISTKRVVHKLGPHRNWVMHVMFAADSAHIVALDFVSWVHVWDIATGARIREFSLQDHTHLRSPIISPDGAGILVSCDNSTTRTVSLWKPGTRAWPAYHITEDGWVYAMSPGRTRRLCWLPQEWRALWWSEDGKLYVSMPEVWMNQRARKRLTVLNVSQIVKYIDSLDTSL